MFRSWGAIGSPIFAEIEGGRGQNGTFLGDFTWNDPCIKSAQLTQNHNQIGYAWYPRRAVASFPVERSSEVTLWRHQVAVRFLPITFDRDKLGTWGWCHSVRLVKAHRLICNMTYLDHTVTLTVLSIWRGWTRWMSVTTWKLGNWRRIYEDGFVVPGTEVIF